MSAASEIRTRVRHTAARLKKLGRVTAALKVLQTRRRRQLAEIERHGLTIFGIDYAWGRPHASVLHKAGVKFAMRYLSHDAGKNLSSAELRALHGAGIKVGVVWESTANRALQGFDAGKMDATAAKAQAAALGLRDIPIYFAVDFDATDAQKPVIAKYLSGAVSVLGKDRVGVYGSYYVVRYCVNLKVCDWFWQTYAWSGGLIHPDTHVLQYSNGHTLDGVSCDFNKASYIGVGGGMR